MDRHTFILKLKMARLYWPAMREWYSEVWTEEPYARMCCDGRMCGCYGATHFEHWQHLTRPTPKAAD